MARKRRFPPPRPFRVMNPEKYSGDPSNIIVRSSWERIFYSMLDRDPMIESWASEELAIPYISPIDGKTHRYFVDAVYKFKTGELFFAEIKPACETKPPEPPKTKSKKAIERHQEALMTYAVNRAKWEAATKYAEKNGGKFIIITENELRVLGARIS